MIKARVSRFLIAGIIATGLSYISFPFLYKFVFRHDFNVSFITSFFLNITSSFVLQKYFVFKSNGQLFYEYIRFLFNGMLLVLIGYLFLQYLMLQIKYPPFYANFIVVTVSAVGSYFIHSLVTFRNK